MASVVSIATRIKSRAEMVTCTSATVTYENGIGNDSRGKKRNNRQVTLLSKENWDLVCSELNSFLPWTYRRANILVEGVNLLNTTGQKLQIGTALLEITGELDPCKRMDEQFEGLTSALMKNWRGGVTCKILLEGEIKAGDQVQFF